MRKLDGWALFAFSAGTCFLFGEGQQRLIGIIMIASFPVANVFRIKAALKRLFPVPPEIWLYTAWVAWAGLTGLLVAVDAEMFWTGMRVLLQVFVLVWAAYAILSNLASNDSVFLGLLVGSLVQIGLVFSGASSVGSIMDTEERAMGSATNPNGLGFLMVWSAFCALLYWFQSKRWKLLCRGLILAYLPLATYVMLSSGSRKSTLAMGLLLYLWAVFGPRPAKGARNIILSLFLGGSLLLGFVSFLPDFIDATPAGMRFQQFVDDGRGDIGYALYKHDRYIMYIDGVNVSLKNPLFGVGVNNLRYYLSTGGFSHSNYIEPLATTGFFGFVLYQAFYFLPILRIRRMLKVVQDKATRYRLKVYLLGLMAILVIGFGAPYYTNGPVYLILTAISVHTFRLERKLRAERAQQHALAVQQATAGGSA